MSVLLIMISISLYPRVLSPRGLCAEATSTIVGRHADHEAEDLQGGRSLKPTKTACFVSSETTYAYACGCRRISLEPSNSTASSSTMRLFVPQILLHSTEEPKVQVLMPYCGLPGPRKRLEAVQKTLISWHGPPYVIDTGCVHDAGDWPSIFQSCP